MKITISYQLKSKNARDMIDLQDYAGAIIYGVKKVFPSAWVDVESTVFKITASPEELSQLKKLQAMGRLISYYCAPLRECVVEYGNSRQLFRRVEVPKVKVGRKKCTLKTE